MAMLIQKIKTNKDIMDWYVLVAGLLANEIKEAQFVLESIRAKYSQELQVRNRFVDSEESSML